jgi:hypothetical protein
MLYSRLVPNDNAASTGVARRNFRLGALNGLFFSVADRLMDPTLVLVAFVSHLTVSPLWLGLIVPLTDGGWFLPQFFVSGFLQRYRQKLRLYQQVAYVRVVVWLALVAAVFLVRQPGWLLAAFFACYGLHSLASGLSGLSFLEVVGKTIAPRRRGEFFAWRLMLGGVAGLGGSALVRWLVDDAGPLAFPLNFAVLFAAAMAMAVIGVFAFFGIVEAPDAALPPRTSLPGQMRRAVGLVRTDSNYQRFLLLRIMLMVASSATPFFAVYVQRQLGGPLSMVGVYLAVYTAANLLAHVGFGRYSSRAGNRRTMVAAAVAGLAMIGLVLALALAATPLGLSGQAAAWCLLPVFALLGMRESGIGVASHSLLLDIAPPAERSLYLGFTNTLLGVVIVATALSGVVVQVFGFLALFVVALAAHVLALLAAVQMRDVHEPVAAEPMAVAGDG